MTITVVSDTERIEALEKELRSLRMSILESKYVDMTPDDELAERILSAYIDDTQWSDHMPELKPTNKLCIELNALTAKRNEILRKALSSIKSDAMHGKRQSRE